MEHKSDNRGLTLVELIISMTIAVFVIAAVSMLITNALKQYTTVTAEVSVQTEGQAIYNQISDMLVESNHVEFVKTGPEEAVLKIYDIKDPSAADYYERKRKEVIFRRNAGETTGRIYLRSVDNNSMESSTKEDLMGEYIKDINAVITTAKNRVQLTISLELNGRTEELEGTITLRNRLKDLP